ncbi:MAG: hypothetical protein ACK5EA_22455, partial [Planctomycetaceae bacterium]
AVPPAGTGRRLCGRSGERDYSGNGRRSWARLRDRRPARRPHTHGHRKHDGHREERAGDPPEHAGFIIEPVLELCRLVPRDRRWSPGG